MMTFLLWLLLLVFCWPLALLAIVVGSLLLGVAIFAMPLPSFSASSMLSAMRERASGLRTNRST